MDPDDVKYLSKKGAFTIPEPELRDACLRSFFQYVQPCFPVLDMKKVQACINQSDPSPEQLSLLVFQAMMFVGSIWVDIRLLRRLGFLTRHEARKAMHGKVRLLYDSDYEDDRTCLVQSLILLTFWWESPNENKDAWHWIGAALSVSRTMGLHQPCAEEPPSFEVSRFRKRLWWTLLMRDSISSFGLSRAPRIRDEDHFVDMLEMEDFDFHDTVSDFMPGTIPPLVGKQRLLARLCIELSKLSRILRRILQLAYPESSSGQTASLYSNRQLNGMNKMTLPRKAPDIEQLKLCDEELSLWRQRAPEEILHAPPIPQSPEAFERAELAHRALLSMIYYTTLMALHRPQILTSSSVDIPTQSPLQAGQDKSRTLVRYAAKEITKIGMDFYEADLVGSLSATCISCILPAGISHIFDMNSTNNLIRSEGLQRFHQCKRLLREFSDAHIAGEWGITILDNISAQVQKQNLAGKDDLGQQSGGTVGHSAQIQHEGTTQSRPDLHLERGSDLDTSTFGKTAVSHEAMNGPSAAHHTNISLATNTASLPSHVSFQAMDAFGQTPNLGTLGAAAAPAFSNEFANTIGLGDMWLDIAGMVNTNVENDWMGSDGFWAN